MSTSRSPEVPYVIDTEGLKDSEVADVLRWQLGDEKLRREVALRHSLRAFADGMIDEADQAGVRIDYLAPSILIAGNALHTYDVLTKAVAEDNWPAYVSPPQYFAELLDDVTARPIRTNFGASRGDDGRFYECDAAVGTETMNEIRQNLGYAAIDVEKRQQDGK